MLNLSVHIIQGGTSKSFLPIFHQGKTWGKGTLIGSIFIVTIISKMRRIARLNNIKTVDLKDLLMKALYRDCCQSFIHYYTYALQSKDCV